MSRGTFPVLLAAGWMTWWGAEMKQVAALTLYRIGGENLPPPTIATEALDVEVVRLTWDELPFSGSDAPVTLVQLPWAGVTENRFGGTELVKLTEDYAAPRRLEPEVNVVPVLEEMGGWLRVTAGDLNGAVFSEQDELEKMRDGDLNTAYFGTDGLAWGLGGTTWGACDSQWPSDSSQSERDPASDRPNIPGWPCRIKLYKIFNFNLGGPYNVERVFFRTRPGRYEAQAHVKEFWVLTNVGDTNRGSYWIGMKAGTFRVDVAHHVAENVSGVIDLEISQSPVQYVLLAVEVGPEESPASKARWEVAEFEIYGTGYVPEARYTSNVIDLGGPASLGEVTWAGRKDEGARVDIRVRSGDDPDPNTYWMWSFRGDERTRFDADGQPIDRDAYFLLEGGARAGISPDTEHWEFWTPPLDFEDGSTDRLGTQPHRFVQFETEFVSSRSHGGGQLDWLQFKVTRPPLANRVFGEIVPPAVGLGELSAFTYKLLPLFEAGDLGFDTVEIVTPAEPVVDAVRIGTRTLARVAFDEDVADGEYAADYDDGHRRLIIRLSRLAQESTGELVEVDFQAAVYRVGTTFSGRVFDSERAFEVSQRVAPGDADPLVDSNSLTVRLTEMGRGSVQNLRVVPPVFTPDGDGANDDVDIVYDLVNLTGTVPVSLHVYDLAGRRFAVASSALRSSGRVTTTWDGSDGEGRLLPPGLYILRLRVEADEPDMAVATVGLAY